MLIERSRQVQIPSHDQLATWIPMIVVCPPALAATLAFILRGFRRRQTLVALLQIDAIALLQIGLAAG